MSRRSTRRSPGTALILLSCALVPHAFLGGCSSTGIAIREQLGYAKREQLVARVEEARDSQTEAKQQFASALDEFMAITGVKGGELEGQYKKIRSAYQRSESKAEDVRSRIRSVERVAAALFKEWEGELGQFQSADLRESSRRQLEATRSKYDQLVGAMKAAEAKMDPVLRAFKDRELFLKHNLNAQAIASLEGQIGEMETDVQKLIAEMNQAISEADSFIAQMSDAPAAPPTGSSQAKLCSAFRPRPSRTQAPKLQHACGAGQAARSRREGRPPVAGGVAGPCRARGAPPDCGQDPLDPSVRHR
ncbi:MAG: DUF2959 domain-containing protein [Planctomycetota bacterium]|nr:DUF2959 domain-containing protein [Planctomycetota bacterium]